jgi:LysM repeat protein
VAAGDSFIGIATTYNLTIDGLFEVSGLDNSSILQPGQEVVVGHQPRPQEVGGSSNLAGEEIVTATATATILVATATATPIPPTATETSIAAVVETETAVPTIAPDTQETESASSGIRIQSVLAAVLGLVGALALGGAVVLFVGKNR